MYRKTLNTSVNFDHQETKHATDNQIDKLVYELYDLADEEIQIVEDPISRR